MLIFGAPCCCCSERGAFGFSNDKSLTYWARTLSCGAAWLASAPAGGPPLVDAMKLSSGVGGPGAIGGVANIRLKTRQGRGFLQSAPEDGLWLSRFSGTLRPW